MPLYGVGFLLDAEPPPLVGVGRVPRIQEPPGVPWELPPVIGGFGFCGTMPPWVVGCLLFGFESLAMLYHSSVIHITYAEIDGTTKYDCFEGDASSQVFGDRRAIVFLIDENQKVTGWAHYAQVSRIVCGSAAQPPDAPTS